MDSRINTIKMPYRESKFWLYSTNNQVPFVPFSFIIKLIYWMVKWRGVCEGLGFINGSLYIATQIDGRKLVTGAGTDSSRVPASWEAIWP